MGPNARMLYGVQLFNLHRERGRLPELDEAITTFARTYPNLPVWRCALALTRLQQGRSAEAREELEDLSAHDFANLPADGNWLIAVTLLADVAIELRDTERAAMLRRMLAPYEQRVVVVAQGASCRGSVAHYLGRLASTCGDPAAAVVHLRRAVTVHDALGARPFGARSRLALADCLEALAPRDDAIDAAEVAALRRDAQATAEELGLAATLPGDVTTAAAVPSPTSAGPRAREPAPHGRNDASPHDPVARMVRDEGRWTISFEGRTTTLRDAKGLHYLARLLAEPDADHPAVLLEGGERSSAVDRTAARGRFQELRDALAEADRVGDPDRAADVREQMSALADSLTGADRVADGRAEQARVNVTRAIRTALRNLRAEDAALADHLDQALRTGASCTYRPDPRAPITWLVDSGAEATS